jgi:hypothetical protein
MDKNEFNDILDEHIENMKKEPALKKEKKRKESEDSYHSSDDYSEYESEKSEFDFEWENKKPVDKKVVIKGVEYTLVSKVFHERLEMENDYAL